ncbi:RluA family pseudouridine synthase, partial [Streptococcus dysgalactiae]
FKDPFTENECRHAINLTDDFESVIIDLQKKR